MISLEYLGYHESPQSVKWQSAESEGVRTFQVMLGSPRTYLNAPLTSQTIGHIQKQGIHVVAHGPYVTSFVTNQSKLMGLSKRYLYEFTKNCLVSGVSHMVFHVGGIAEGQTYREGQIQLQTLLTQWSLDFYGKPITLCMETDPGSKNGRRVGGVKFLYPVIKAIDCEQVRLCWDWEHSYANGLSLENEKVISQLLDYTDVVHMNAIPYYVEQGSHLDRHSETNFHDSKYPVQVYRSIWEMMKSKSHQIIGILERESWERAKVDYDLVRQWEDV